MEISNDPNWTDYVIAIATVFAALGTVGAVIVALFGQDWRHRRTRPAMTLEAPDFGEIEVSVAEPILDAEDNLIGEDAWASTSLELSITNQRGRETARDVSLLVTVRDDEHGWVRVRQQPVTWESGLLGHYGSETTDIPPGVSKAIGVVYVGSGKYILERHYHAELLSEEDQDIAKKRNAAVAIYPARNDMIRWLVMNREYSIDITVAGSNFDAQTYRGRFMVKWGEYRSFAPAVSPTWLVRPYPISESMSELGALPD